MNNFYKNSIHILNLHLFLTNTLLYYSLRAFEEVHILLLKDENNS